MKFLYALCPALRISGWLAASACAASLSVQSATAQTLHYYFGNTLQEFSDAAPALSILGNEGSFVSDYLEEFGEERIVYQFGQNDGLQFADAAADDFLGGSYTIELYFKMDNLNSWRRVVDWKNRTTDYGAYVYFGQLNFYPYEYSEEAPVLPDEYTYYVITRDEATEEVLIYSDAEVMISFIDDSGDALVGDEGFLNFFQDDLVVPNEASSGTIAMLKLYDHKLEPEDISLNYTQLEEVVLSARSLKRTDRGMSVYPNPAIDQVTLRLDTEPAAHTYVRLLNLAGQVVWSRPMSSLAASGASAQQVNFSLPDLPAGIYFLSLENDLSTMVTKLVVQGR